MGESRRLADLFPATFASAPVAQAPAQMSADLAQLTVAGISADSRKIAPGYVFAALQGSGSDGADYLDAAKANGAVAVLADRDLSARTDLPMIRVDNARHALALAARSFFPRQPEIVVAITGTNGKSSTVDYCRQIWTHLGLRAASLGTLGAVGPEGVIDLGHTTPDPVAIHTTLQRLADQNVTHAAMEASSHGLDQSRLDGVTLAAVGFTNLTQDHLDYHANMAEYRRAKLRLFTQLAKPGIPAIINADSPERDAFLDAARQSGLDIVDCGWRAEKLKIGEMMPRQSGQRLFLRWDGREYACELPLIGEFQALNAVCAAAFVLALNARNRAFAAADVFGAMERLRGVRGRLEEIGLTATGASVFVDYAHTPDGLEVLLRAARPHAAGRVIVVFGCGGDRDAGKRPKMGAIAQKFADLVIVTDDNPRSEDPALIRQAIRAAASGSHEIGSRHDAIAFALSQARAGDVVLVAGKGHETGQIVAGIVHPFSDHQVITEFLLNAGGHLV